MDKILAPAMATLDTLGAPGPAIQRTVHTRPGDCQYCQLVRPTGHLAHGPGAIPMLLATKPT